MSPRAARPVEITRRHAWAVAIAAVAIVAAMAQRLGLEASLEAVALLLAATVAVAGAIVLTALAARVLSFGRLQRSGSLSIGITAVALWAAAARVHYALFRVGLDPDTLRVALDALSARELELPRGALLGVLGGGAVVLAAGAVIARILARGQGDIAASLSISRLALTAGALLCMAIVAVEPIATRPHAEHTAPLRDLLPWQQAATSERLALRRLALRDPSGAPLRQPRGGVDAAVAERRQRAGQLLAAPPTPLEGRSILLIVMESFRADLVEPSTTPFLASLSQSCLSPRLHYSTGANTEAGLFGLLHGLSMHYFWHTKESRDQPLPLQLLGRMGYQRSLYRTFGLAYSNLGERFLAREIDREVAVEDGDGASRDEAIMSRLIADLEAADGAPRFDLVITYATHWSYSYPAEFAIHQPTASADLVVHNATAESPLRVHAVGLHNRQRNAAHYTDSLIARVFAALERGGRLEQTMVVITGDHGEAFFEHGRLGHTWSLENEMIRVPLFICGPGLDSTRYRFSDHSDVFPTIFDWMGIAEHTGVLTSGKSLLSYDPARDYAMYALHRRRSLMRMGIAGDPYKIEFHPFGELAPLAIRTLDDEAVPEPEASLVRRILQTAARARP